MPPKPSSATTSAPLDDDLKATVQEFCDLYKKVATAKNLVGELTNPDSHDFQVALLALFNHLVSPCFSSRLSPSITNLDPVQAWRCYRLTLYLSSQWYQSWYHLADGLAQWPPACPNHRLKMPHDHHFKPRSATFTIHYHVPGPSIRRWRWQWWWWRGRWLNRCWSCMVKKGSAEYSWCWKCADQKKGCKWLDTKAISRGEKPPSTMAKESIEK